VKDLNPQRKGDGDTLHEGEIIRLPALGTPSETAIADRGAEPSAAPASQSPPAAAAIRPQLAPLPVAPFDAESVLRAPARANMLVISRVLAALGSELQANGEESIKLPEGTVHFDKSMYPIVSDPTLRQRVVLDLDGNIPASLKGQLNDPSIGIPVVPIAEGQSLQQAVERLLAALGYQPLPTGRPVVVQQAGIGVEAKGS